MDVFFYLSYIALWILVLFIAILLVLVYRHFGLLAMGTVEGVKNDGLAIGEAAREIIGSTLQGDLIQWHPKQGTSYLLLFASPSCEACSKIIPTVNYLATHNSGIEVLAVVPGSQESIAILDKKFSVQFNCIAEDGTKIFEDYKVRLTPFAYIIGEDSLIRAKGLCTTASRLQELLVAAEKEDVARLVGPVVMGTGTQSIELMGIKNQ